MDVAKGWRSIKAQADGREGPMKLNLFQAFKSLIRFENTDFFLKMFALKKREDPPFAFRNNRTKKVPVIKHQQGHDQNENYYGCPIITGQWSFNKQEQHKSQRSEIPNQSNFSHGVPPFQECTKPRLQLC